jgi:hypothetical protein
MMPEIDTVRELERLESWLPDRREAIACRTLKEMIPGVILLEQELWNHEKELRNRVFADPFVDLQAEFHLNTDLLRRLAGIMAKMLGFCSMFKSMGYDVEKVQELHDSLANLMFAIMPDEEFFAGGWLEERGVAAVVEADRGDTELMESFSE